MQLIRFVILWLFLSLVNWLNANAQLVINEYSTANLNTVTDNYGEYEDWFEIYNAGSASVTLTGYYLSNKPSDPTKWQFPSGSISAGGYARIWASERNTVVGNNYHANFKLQQTKPHVIVLSDPSGVIIDSVTIRRHQPNHSWGRATDGNTNWGVFISPTPNSTNSAITSYTRYANKPTYSQPSGFYGGTQSIALSTNEPGATIYYTTNGYQPTTSSTVYSGPISVAITTVIKALVAVTDPTVLPGFYEFNTYFINDNHTVPVVSIAGNDILTLLNGSWGSQPVTSIEYFDYDQSLKFKTVGVGDKHGNDSWAYDQRGIDYSAFDQYGYDHYMKHKIFPRTDRDKFQRVILKAAASDNYPFGGGSQQCHLRDAFVHDYSEKIGLNLDGRRTQHCVVYANGEYWGFYEVREKMDDHDFTEYYYDQPKDSIDLLKFWGGLQVDYGTNTDWNNFYAYIMANDMTDPVAYQTVKDWLSFSNFRDYCIYNTYIVNTDWINWNTMWWRGHAVNGDHKKWHYVLWDEDNTFDLGQNYSGWQTTGPNADPCDLANNFQNAGANMGTFDILGKLLENEEFHTEYINRYADLMNGKLSCDSVIDHLNWFESTMLPEMPGQTTRWGGTVPQWQNNVQNMRDFINDRCAYIAGSITGCYDVTGPYTLTVIVDPPGTGKVKIGSFTPPGYPYTGTYFGSIDIHLEATPNNDYIFGYWIPGIAAVSPNILSDTINMEMVSNDTIIAHFKYWPDSVVLGVENDYEALNVAVFPTVTNDQVVIDFQNLPEGVSSCRLYDITGKLIVDATKPIENMTNGREVISMKTLGLSAGMYYVELTAGQHKRTQKIVYQIED